MCTSRSKISKKAPVFSPGQEVQIKSEPDSIYKIEAVLTQSSGRKYRLETHGTVIPRDFSAGELQLYLPRAFFYLWAYKDGSLDDSMRDENGYSPSGYRPSSSFLYDYTRLDFTKTEMARLRQPEIEVLGLRGDEEEEDD